MLAGAVQENGHKDGVFGHPFFVVMWNLVCRSNNVTAIQLEHLEMHGDAIGVFFSQTKTDQVASSAGICSRLLLGFARSDVLVAEKYSLCWRCLILC